MQRFKTIYFIYNADGGLLNEVKYWVNKNIFKRPTACELCGISHGKIFVKSEWLKFINDLQRDYKVEVLHRNEIPRKIEIFIQLSLLFTAKIFPLSKKFSQVVFKRFQLLQKVRLFRT